MTNISLGVLAHVDAGKTTLSEALLYKTGAIKTPGRVDKQNAFLDTNRIEKSRGITVFSKQAIFNLGEKRVFLQDTPGHADFSSEMERSLAVLDYAVLVISAPDGIQAHTELLLELLEKYQIPCFIFVNKTDLSDNRLKLQNDWVEFGGVGAKGALPGPDPEAIAMCSEEAMEEYLESGEVSDNTIATLIKSRKLMPVYYGSALRLDGVDELLTGLEKYALPREYPDEFGAKCFKITRDKDGSRLSWVKLTGGSLKLRSMLGEEKITSIRFYSGDKFETADEVGAGCICALTGLEKTYAGMGLGFEEDHVESSLEPVLSYTVKILDGTDDITAMKYLNKLAEEDPLLKITRNETNGQIEIMLMGEIQTQVLKTVIEDRFGMEVSIESGKVVYKETISKPAIGIGHFEPLRHYAETHLLLEPLPRGCGIILETACSEDLLDRNWQRLILYNLAEYKHKGVLTGSLLTDVKITLIAGRDHLKHTEGGDFRQATLRAIRMGLMSTESVLLEPYYKFVIKVPSGLVGRTISDLKAFGANISDTDGDGEYSVLSGLGPVSELASYNTELLSYTKGKGKMNLRYDGYYPCHNAQQVIEAIGYNPDRDIDNQSSSVFCSHGSGVYVNWDHVAEFAHIDSGISASDDGVIEARGPRVRSGNIDFDQKELDAIMEREFGQIKRPVYSTVVYEPEKGYKKKSDPLKKEYIIVDGYNMIFGWKVFKDWPKENLAYARESLVDILAGFKATRGCECIVVFDGYKVRGNEGSKFEQSGVNVVYTKEGVSADGYIEAFVAELGNTYSVAVASSDGLIQLTALRKGTRRMSALELEHEVLKEKEKVNEILERHKNRNSTLAEVVHYRKLQ